MTHTPRPHAAASPSRARQRRRPSWGPRSLETLEERALLSVVTTTADDGAGSLRQAIRDVNCGADPGPITFDLPGSGVQTINLLSPLPAVTVPVAIDGTSQPGYAGSPLVELNGAGAGEGAYGLVLAGGGSTVEGLTINGFGGANLVLEGYGGNVVQGNFIGSSSTGTKAVAGNGVGILIDGGSSGNRIGTNADGVDDAAERNLIAGNGGAGVLVADPHSAGNVIAGNWIGTDVTGGKKLANQGGGVDLNGSGNVVGGSAAGAGNLISGNLGSGIVIEPGSAANVVQGNTIGATLAGTKALANTSDGVTDYGTGNTIGGTSAGEGNLISANLQMGIDLVGASADFIAGNRIGTNAAGTSALANSANGIQLQSGATGNTIGAPGAGANVIAFNNPLDFFGDGGVVVLDTSTRNAIEFNAIHDNNGLGIDLGGDGVTPGTDTGAGPNGGQPSPVITSLVPSGATTTVSGTVSGTPGASFVLDFYVNAAPDPSSYGEGQTYAGSSPTLTWGADGTAAFSVTLPLAFATGQYVSATATGPNGTSEFSPDAGAQSVPTITWATPDPIVYGTPIGGDQLDATASVPGTFSYSPDAGTVLDAGSAQLLTVTFTPDDTAGYTTATASVFLHVLKAPATFTALAAPAVTYGDASVVLSGQVGAGAFVPDGDVAITFNGSTQWATLDAAGHFAATFAAAGLTVSAGPYPVTFSYLGSQNFLAATDASRGVAVNPKPLTVTAADAARAYGDPNPALTGTLAGVVPGDAITASYTAAADPTSPVGTYAIVPTLSDPDGRLSNYTVTPANGTLTVTPASLSVTANGASMQYGGPLPAFGATVVGARNGDDTGGGLVISFATAATGASHVGGYAVVPSVSGPAAANYTVTTNAGTLTVTPAPLTITADNQSKVYGAPVPALTVSYTGFVNQDTAASLTSLPVAGTSATASSGVAGGPYAINVSGAADPDYAIQYAGGLLTVVAADSALQVAASNPAVPAGQAVTLTASAAAVAPGAGTPGGSVTFYDGASVLGSAPLVGGVATLSVGGLAVGVHAVHAGYSGDGNFHPSAAGSVSVTVLASVYVLDPSALGAVTVWGNTQIDVTGGLVVDSSSPAAILAGGNARLSAGSIALAGGFRAVGHAAVNPSPVTGAPASPDPFAALAPPTAAQAGPFRGAVDISGHTSLTISPGVYTSVRVAGNATLTLKPGIYVIAGGGLTATGNAHLNGSGVLIYNAGGSFPGAGGRAGDVAVVGHAAVNLTPATAGPYANVLVFQARDNAAPLVLSGSAVAGLSTGALYAPSALLAVAGTGQVTLGTVVVDRLAAVGLSAGDLGTSGSRGGGGDGNFVVIDPHALDAIIRGFFGDWDDDCSR